MSKNKLTLIAIELSCLTLFSCSKTISLNNYYVSDSSVLANPLAKFYDIQGNEVNSFNPVSDEGKIEISVSFGTLNVNDGWTAFVHATFAYESNLINFDDKIENCSSELYLVNMVDADWNQYTHDLKSIKLFNDSISFSIFKTKYKMIIFVFEIYDAELELVTSYRCIGSIVYSDENISKIDFGKIALN